MCGKLEITEFKMRGEGSHESLQDKWVKNTAHRKPSDNWSPACCADPCVFC